jgi:uncharacterized repeat protein (TIGR03806 family)
MTTQPSAHGHSMSRVAIAFSWLIVAVGAHADVTLPADFRQTQIASGVTGATAMEIAPDGRLFLCEQTGAVRVVKDDALLAEPFLTLKVDSEWERGLIGIALDPDFAANHYVYLCYVAPEPYPHHRVSRVTADGDVAVAGSEVILFEGDDQNKLGGEVRAGHQGGAIHFGKDGKLYVAIGEQTAGQPSQQMDTLLGKMLRLNRDGSIPDDNPFFNTAQGKYRAIWALGLRNPFTFAVQPGTGRIYINDVGGAQEEVNEGFAGANYGWPTVEHGPTNDVRFRGPIHWYPTSSITGGTFCAPGPGANRFPSEYLGKYFFMDFSKGWIKVLDPDHSKDVVDFANGLARPVDLRFGSDGNLYYLLRDAWVKDKDFRPNTGSLWKIRYERGAGRPAAARLAKTTPPPAPYPAVLPAPGSYSGPIHVRVTLGAPATEVHYTLDGSSPTQSSPVFHESVPVDSSATLRAQAFKEGTPNGPAVSAMYTITGKIRYGMPDRPEVRGLNVPLDPAGLPPRLSQTGLFATLSDLTPSAGLVPYTVNSPLWSDGAKKLRWVALSGGERIGFVKTGEWSFPRGTIFIKHFELAIDETQPTVVRRLETRLLVVDGSGGGYGATYRWTKDETDAALLGSDGATEEITIKTASGSRSQVWSYPSRDDCLKCHTINAGFVLGPKARQLNGEYRYPSTGITDNQLRTWGYLGMLKPAPVESQIAGLDRLIPIGDHSAPLQDRVRSYLDANCQHCHRPGANIPAAFDARFDTPLARQNLLEAPTVSDTLGIIRPRLVAGNDVARSLLYQRMVQVERFKMPPLARNQVDEEAARLLKAWIESLPLTSAANARPTR